MAATLSQTVLKLLHQLEHGQDQRAALAFLVEHAIASAEKQREAFAERASKNPEVTPELAQRVDTALLELERSFQQVKAVAATPSPTGWSESSRRLERALEGLHQLQHDYLQTLQQGPTAHPQLNRLLLHLRAWQSTATCGALAQDLIDGLVAFEQQMSDTIDGLESDVQQVPHSLLASLMDTCDEVVGAFQAAEAGSQARAEWRDQIVGYSRDLDHAISLALESQLAEGPTSLASVNLVLLDLTRFLHQEISAEVVSETIRQCEFLLRSQLDCEADSSLLEAAHSVFSALQSLQEALGNGQEELLISRERALLEATGGLARYAALFSCEESLLDLVSSEGVGMHSPGLPLLLAETLQQCYQHLNGLGPEGIEDCQAALQSLVSTTRGQLRMARDPAPVRDRAGQTLQILEQICTALDEFRMEPGPELYATLEQLLYQAGELALGLALPSS